MSALQLNHIVLGGNLTRDPALRTLPSGTSVAEFGLAINDNYTAKDGSLIERTCFVEIVVWSRRAESAHTYLHKGDRLIVEGKLVYDSWENEQGERRSRLRVHARQLHFLGGGQRKDATETQAESVESDDTTSAVAQDDGMPF